MPAGTQTFVFIDEVQQKKYSKITLSTINAHVAKYAHGHLQNTPLRLRKPVEKAKSTPTFTKLPEEHNGSCAPDEGRLICTPRRCLEPKSTALVRRNLSGRHTKSGKEKPQNDQEHFSAPQIVIDFPAKYAKLQSKRPPPEALAGLFRNLCRITKCPTYQAFPFFLNLEEKRLAHYWFTELLRQDFGMELQLEDTFQGQLTKYPLAFEVPLRWILARAADQLNAKVGLQSPTAVYRLREKALTKLQATLSDHDIATDEAIGSILLSISHDTEHRKVHLRGMNAMIEARGGLEEVVKACRVTCAEHILLQYTFADYDIADLRELEQLKSLFFGAIMEIQEHARNFTNMNRQMETWAASAGLLDCTLAADKMQKWFYTEQRNRIFSEETALGQLSREQVDPTSNTMRKSRLFAALFQLNTMLVEYESLEERLLFLRRLDEATSTASTRDPQTGNLTMMAGAHIYNTGYVNRKVQQELYGVEYRYDEIGLRVSEQGIAAVKIFNVLPDTMRHRFIQLLQTWLLGNDTGYLSPDDMRTLWVTIRHLWLQKMKMKRYSCPD